MLLLLFPEVMIVVMVYLLLFFFLDEENECNNEHTILTERVEGMRRRTFEISVLVLCRFLCKNAPSPYHPTLTVIPANPSLPTITSNTSFPPA
jgi:hypothetical protein